MIDGAKASLSANFNVDPSISDAIFGIVVYGAAIISIFYFLVPFKWYLRVFKGKAYADNYKHYLHSINRDLDDATDIIYYLKEENLGKTSSVYFDKTILMEKLKRFNIKHKGE
jgi:hypothetical protein